MNNNQNSNRPDKYKMIADLLQGPITLMLLGSAKDLKRCEAVERYMRTYLRALTYPELYDEWHGTFSPPRMLTSRLRRKVEEAMAGYDCFMAERERLASRKTNPKP